MREVVKKTLEEAWSFQTVEGSAYHDSRFLKIFVIVEE